MVDKRDRQKEVPCVPEECCSHSKNMENIPKAQARSRLLEDTNMVESRDVFTQIQTPQVLLPEIATLVAWNPTSKTSTFGISATAGSSMYYTEELAGKNDQEGLFEAAASSFANTIMVPSC